MNNRSVVLITGAAGGIGRALARRFAAGDYRVVIADLDGAGLGEVAGELQATGAECLSIAGNLEQDDYLRQLVSDTVQRFGRMDAVIHNAAWRTLDTMRQISREDWEKTFRICVTAPAFLSRYAAVVMEENGTPGVIVNIASVMAQRAGGSSPAYVAAKGALESLTYELATLYGPRGIRVLGVNPGNIVSGLSADYQDENGHNIAKALSGHVNDLTPLGRPGTPEEIAHLCYWLCSPEASFLTGTTVLADGGLQHNFNAYSFKRLQFPHEF